METLKTISPFYSVSEQIKLTDLGAIAAAGFKTVINNRPDGEADGQPSSEDVRAAVERHGMTYHTLPVVSGNITDDNVSEFTQLMQNVTGPVLGYCRTGTRSSSLWALSEARHLDPEAILRTCASAGYDLNGLLPRLQAQFESQSTSTNAQAAPQAQQKVDVLIIGGGAGGIASATSLIKRRPELNIAIVEPSEKHYYQPGWTMVGGGIFDRDSTERSMASVMPEKVKWIRAAATTFEPQQNQVVLENGDRIGYRTMIVAPGLQLRWDQIEGLSDTLGKNGVTSNYFFDMAPYTWELVQGMKSGKAIFTQPPMPIKCAGAPQKAMYLSCDHWNKSGALGNIDVEFNNAGGVLFGVAAFVPSLMKYVEKYNANLCFNSNLIKVDGPAKKAWFKITDGDGNSEVVEKSFDFLHVCPPQSAPEFIRNSPLANEGGWLDVSPETLQHARYSNIYGVGDVHSAPNAKTAAAVRKQAPLVSENVIATLEGKSARAVYDGYGACPLTVERGKVVMAEFGYGGKLLPSLPLNPIKPRKFMWFLKEKLMPYIYFEWMLKGKEYLAEPKVLSHDPTSHEKSTALN